MSNDQQYPQYPQRSQPNGANGANGSQGSQGSQGSNGYDQYGQPYSGPQHGQEPDAQHQSYAQQQYGQHQSYAQQPYAQQQYGQQYGQQQYDEAPLTQQWQAQTWDTQMQPAPQPYLPPQGYEYEHGDQGAPLPPQQQEWSAYDATRTPAPAPAQAPAPAPAAEPEPPAPATAAPTTGEPTYGAATTTGNARVTDAQRARAEGRSPVIEPGIQPAALTAVLGLLLAGGAAVGPYALLVPLVLLQAVTAAGWFRLNGMWPARQGIALAFLGGVVADIALLAAGREHGPAAILGTLGVWVLLTLVLQLRSHASPDERMYGLMATVTSAALAIVATGHLAAEPDAVTVGAIAVAVAVVARALPLPTPASVVVALLASAGAGIAVGGMTDLGAGGALLGLGAGVCALIGHRVASYDYPSRFVHMTAGVALPLAAAAPAVYLLGRALA
ncbi:hypothetical protein ACIREE_37185 [Streptomyces sp. NPDC102467]|uniref:hypothetical protein n=1 Tax=Streptomyces sp. NPDC102467 TaxID=3366179 RepID=UPI00381029F2